MINMFMMHHHINMMVHTFIDFLTRILDCVNAGSEQLSTDVLLGRDIIC